jgi:hypothetical protein
VSELDPLQFFQLVVSFLNFFDPKRRDLVVPLFKDFSIVSRSSNVVADRTGVAAVRTALKSFLLYFFIDLLEELLPDSFRSFFMLELLFFLHFFQYDCFKFPLVINLLLMAKLNELCLSLSNWIFTKRAYYR